MKKNFCHHWSEVEWLSKTVKNKNIIIKGEHSYYSGYFDGCFEDTVVRYLYGDAYSIDSATGWVSQWQIDLLFIGNYVQIAPGVKIIMGGNNTHNTRNITTYPFLNMDELKKVYKCKGNTIIGDSVWIGMEAIIMPGVKIGNGAVIAARSVVLNDVPPYSIVAGNPAQVVRLRFSEAEIALLEKIKWHDWPETKIQKLLPFILSDNVQDLISASERYDLVFL